MLRTRSHYSIFLGAILIALFSCNAVSSQTDSGARKFDEFGDIEASDLIARLDNLAIQLQNEPNKKAFLVVYRTRRDLPVSATDTPSV